MAKVGGTRLGEVHEFDSDMPVFGIAIWCARIHGEVNVVRHIEYWGEVGVPIVLIGPC